MADNNKANRPRSRAGSMGNGGQPQPQAALFVSTTPHMSPSNKKRSQRRHNRKSQHKASNSGGHSNQNSANNSHTNNNNSSSRTIDIGEQRARVDSNNATLLEDDFRGQAGISPHNTSAQMGYSSEDDDTGLEPVMGGGSYTLSLSLPFAMPLPHYVPHLEEMGGPSPVSSPRSRIVRLNIGGKFFETTRETLVYGGGRGATYFTALFSGRIPPTLDKDGAYFIDRDGQFFAPILTYLRTGEVRIQQKMTAQDVLCEARFYGIQDLVYKLERRLRPRSTLIDFNLEETPDSEGNSESHAHSGDDDFSCMCHPTIGGGGGYRKNLKEAFVERLVRHPKATLVRRKLVEKILGAATQKQQGGRLIVMESGETRTVNSRAFGQLNVSLDGTGESLPIDIADKDCVQYFSSGLGIEVFRHFFRTQQIEVKIERLHMQKELVGVMFMFNVHFIDDYSAKPVYIVRQ